MAVERRPEGTKVRTFLFFRRYDGCDLMTSSGCDLMTSSGFVNGCYSVNGCYYGSRSYRHQSRRHRRGLRRY